MRTLVLAYIGSAAVWHQASGARVDDDATDPPAIIPELKAAEDDWAKERLVEEAAEHAAAVAGEAERQSEMVRQKSVKDANYARETEQAATATRTKAAMMASLAAQKHQLSQIAENKALVAKDKIAHAARLAAHTMQEKSQADKEQKEAEQTMTNAQRAGQQAAEMTKVAAGEKEKWQKVAAEAVDARNHAKEALQDSKDAQAIVDKMDQQIKSAALQAAEKKALKAKEAEASASVAKSEAKNAADHANEMSKFQVNGQPCAQAGNATTAAPQQTAATTAAPQAATTAAAAAASSLDETSATVQDDQWAAASRSGGHPAVPNVMASASNAAHSAVGKSKDVLEHFHLLR